MNMRNLPERNLYKTRTDLWFSAMPWSNQPKKVRMRVIGARRGKSEVVLGAPLKMRASCSSLSSEARNKASSDSGILKMER